MISQSTAQVDQPTDELVRLRKASADLGVPFVRLAGRAIPEAVLRRLSETTARTEQIIPYEELKLSSGKTVLRLAVSDPATLEREAPEAVHDLHTKDGLVIEVALTPKQDLTAAFDRYRQLTASVAANTEGQKDLQAQIEKSQSAPKVTPRASQAGVQPVDLTRRSIPRSALVRIPEHTARKYRVVVFDVTDQGKTIHVAAEKPDNPQVREFLKLISNNGALTVTSYQATKESIDAALLQYRSEQSKVTEKSGVKKQDTASVEAKKMPVQQRRSTQGADDFWKESEKQKSVKEAQPNVPSVVDAKQSPMSKVPSTAKDTQSTGRTLVNPLNPSQKPAVVKATELSTPNLLVEEKREPIQPLIPVSSDVERDLEGLVGQQVNELKDLEAIAKTGFIPKIVGAVLLLAVKMEASDVHVQAVGEELLIRYRIDGMLRDILKLPSSLHAPIVSRIKILSNLKIDEQRIPQDGRFEVMAGTRDIDLRVSTFPAVGGEKVVMRLLDKSTGRLKFEELGLVGSRIERLQKEIQKPYGVILATGPTGSGKSTMLYAILQEIARPQVNVVTLEDPVEYELPGIAQAQIRPKIGFGFVEGLRSILRQDPDVIMVGEIRDQETANMVTHAALTGHLVLSTLHTNDAAGALPRLINMKVEPFLITSAINAVIAQRLVRRLCDKCRVAWQPEGAILEEVTAKLSEGNHSELTELTNAPLTLYKPQGCDACTDGYRGRVGIFEVMNMSEAIEALAVKRAPASELRSAAIAEGMVTIEQDGMVKALEGLTSLDEVLRVTKTE